EQADQDRDDGNHHEQLDQREARPEMMTRHCGFSLGDYTKKTRSPHGDREEGLQARRGKRTPASQVRGPVARILLRVAATALAIAGVNRTLASSRVGPAGGLEIPSCPSQVSARYE